MNFEEYLKKAEAGDLDAMYYVGSSYYDGTVQCDPTECGIKAGFWLGKCAERNHVMGMRKYAECMIFSDKYQEAYNVYLRAAELGDAQSAYEVAEFYCGEHEIFETVADSLRDKAIEFYKKAYVGGCYHAAGKIVRLGGKVPEVEQNIDLRLKDLVYDAGLGLMEAQFSLGHLYIRDDLNYKQPETGVMLLRLAAEQKHMPATYFMGYVNRMGIGTKKNPEEARRWYNLVVKGGLVGTPDYTSFALDELDKLG